MLQLRPASLDDLPLLEYWDTQPHVVDSDPSDDWNWAEELAREPPWREQLVAELAGEPIGFLQIIDPYHEETHYWGDVAPNLRAIDIWIGEANHLGQGHGTRMMQLAIERCFRHPEVTGILIDPLKTNTRAHRFYERLGFTFMEERSFENDVCYVYLLPRLAAPKE
ncbi:GNAT family N-acetyltransferase [Neolewinella lacunae]|uniref:Acetyltransferase n=1 Tax=Neolewinella lacunae TaxID=1517758 RepID=A0A923PI00_9BACT|nr:GNAT family N-acetyltransferase [Neolewinella lacunae]MBC6994440.1 acetyltransferase [Neolewinella lacunae]MDN3633376.1 GNAT family N-acetyltransferase [Neolewinella lacunae]